MVDLLVSLNIFDSFYGLLSAMMQPLYWAVSGLVVFFHSVFTPLLGADNGWNWALAIVSLTVVIRTLLIPLFVKQINSARNMQLLQPKLAELQKKYGADRERLGQETMKLYQSEGVNPMASCLPLLLQMPIFLALFRVLEGASSGNVRGHFFKENPQLVESLQRAEIFGAGLADRLLPFTPFGSTQVVAIVLVILMVGIFWLTQVQLMRKNMPPESQVGQAAQMQKMMLYFFPFIYAMSAIVIPIGVLVYWLTSNVWTYAQQAILIRNNPAPNTPAYIDWEERMLAKGKDPQQIVLARAEKRRRTKKAPAAPRTVQGATATASPAEGDEQATVTDDAPKVTRQQVTRQTVRTTDDGRRIVQRGPQNKSRASRKKK
ncbi:membrane protein insertase YidC [Tessaracoccus flavus]|jgi:YidC/Oxa1 family membrane protein insertase|uniref:Membrane protein insertase YidC n=1 Tax=Tessaracoccus flavus TaxID=1610493 RepID=A0A1Q2CI33_9ACTN|nr:membrane protein insertase YidC [Tessaracoccus flavus]AQP45715.1 membrane protein insertase YidC [Tessaracoccus flavus]SDZ13081.1 YidC/Oxa1 family membrane protein insertase [Tessaracoccus flavus]